MATYLFHSSLALSIPMKAILYDEALSLKKRGHEVIILYCGGLMTQCYSNICANSSLCSVCKYYYTADISHFSSQIEFLPMTNFVSEEEKKNVSNMSFDYNSIDEIKELYYNGINIGMGVVSGYITASRNMNPLIDTKAKHFFDENLRNAILTTISFENAIAQYLPDEIYLYNGRLADSRPIWQLAEKKKIPYTTLEAVVGVNQQYKSRFRNAIPHSIDYRTKIINDFWEDYSESLEQKKNVGISFFENRRNAEFSGDKIYVKDQEQNLLPEEWDRTKHNIVIFNSSEDEYVSIGKEFSEKALFNNQLEGLKYIKKQLEKSPNINVTLRIHPNLADVKYSYATELLMLQSEKFNVIDGYSPIDSYALIDAADSVVVFGSTIGIESVYWKKPTILLAGSMYYNLDCCYIPLKKEGLIELLQKKLTPKDILPAIKFGYHIMTEHNWDRFSELDFGWKYSTVKIGNLSQVFEINNWQKTLGSRRLASFLRQTRKRLIILTHKYIYRNKPLLELPLKEIEN